MADHERQRIVFDRDSEHDTEGAIGLENHRVPPMLVGPFIRAACSI
jgi:hypothetical protein